MKNISQAMKLLGFEKGSNHGIKRAVYLFRFAKNLENIINCDRRPIWYNRSEEDITSYWKERWAIKRIPPNYPDENLHFSKKEFIDSLKKDIRKSKNPVKNKFQ